MPFVRSTYRFVRGCATAPVVFIVESEELLFGELCAIVRDDGVRNPKAMDDVKEE